MELMNARARYALAAPLALFALLSAGAGQAATVDQTWHCGPSTWVLSRSGALVVHSPPANPASKIPLERIAFRTQGRYELGAKEITVRLERNTATGGPASDIALLGDMADIRMARVSRYAIQRQGSQITLQESFRSVNGQERTNRSTMNCKASR